MTIIADRLVLLPTLCGCGCGRPAPLAQRNNKRRGDVKGQPLPRITGHNKRGTTNLTRYTVLPDGCWRWDGSRTRKGYGRAQVARRHTGAHKALYEVMVGPVPTGLQLDHLCRNTWCVNPAHLEPVTPQENRRRQVSALTLLDQMIEVGRNQPEGTHQS